MEIGTKYLIFVWKSQLYVKCRKVNKLWFLVTFHTIIIIPAFQHDRSYRNTLVPDSDSYVYRWVKYTWVEIVTKYLIFFRNHSSYGYGRKVNKLRVLVTLHAIISAFQYYHSCRNTLFPDSVMSEDELSKLWWKLRRNISIYLEIILQMCIKDRKVNK